MEVNSFEERSLEIDSPKLEKSPETSKQSKNNLPLSKVKQIMKMDPEVSNISSEAVFMITRCAELFIASLSKEAFYFTKNAKRKIIKREDIDSAIDNIDEFAFLEGALT